MSEAAKKRVDEVAETLERLCVIENLGLIPYTTVRCLPRSTDVVIW